MYCKHCGKQILDQAVVCPGCGVATDNASIKPHNRNSNGNGNGNGQKSKLVFVLLGVFLGELGIHNFYAGYYGRAVAQLLITLILGVLIFPIIAVWIWAIVEVFVVNKDANGNGFN